MWNERFCALSVTVAMLLAGCGGSGASASNPSTLPPSKTSSTHATFVVKIPAKASGKGARRPHYITANVQGISFNVTDASNPNLSAFTFYPLTSSSPNCTGTAPSGLTCTLDVVAPPGNDTFVVDLYDATEINAAYIISTATLTTAIAAQAANVINVVTDGVPTWAVMGFATPYPATAGSYPITMYVTDPSGDLIVGSFDAPLTLSDSDTSGDTTLSTTTLSQASDTNNVTLNWNGTLPTLPPVVTLESTDGILVNETGSTVLTTASIVPGGSGPAASQGAYYFANASAASQALTLTGEGASTGPFAVSTTCSAYVSTSGFSPNYTLEPISTTAPVSGGFPQYDGVGSCFFTVTDSEEVSSSYGVIVGQ